MERRWRSPMLVNYRWAIVLARVSGTVGWSELSGCWPSSSERGFSSSAGGMVLGWRVSYRAGGHRLLSPVQSDVL